ncbi:MAG: hypothetical protein FWD98_08735 [Defluviitaleaceae bacterium]|nr:hypothetical protein [Defluviitaleaceae bacterium]
MYYLGIDGSTTYSRIVGADEDMKPIGKNMGGSTRLDGQIIDVVRSNVAKLLKEYNRFTNTKLSDCKGICIGSSSVRTHEDAALLESLFRDAGATCPVKAVSDIEMILATHTKGGAGMVVVAGVRAAGYAVNDSGHSTMVGGWGHLVDDGCSAYSIGMKAIKYALMAYDGRIPPTALQGKVEKYFGLKHISDISDFLYSDRFNVAKVAGLAIDVKYASEEGDEAAKIIEASAAHDVYLMAKGLVKNSGGGEAQLLLAGNVLQLHDSIRDRFKEIFKKDYPNVSVVLAGERPEMGALYLAMKI